MRTLRGVSELFIGILGFASTGRWTALAGDSVSDGRWKVFAPEIKEGL